MWLAPLPTVYAPTNETNETNEIDQKYATSYNPKKQNALSVNLPKQVRANRENVVVLCNTFNIREFPLILSSKYKLMTVDVYLINEDSNSTSFVRTRRHDIKAKKKNEKKSLLCCSLRWWRAALATDRNRFKSCAFCSIMEKAALSQASWSSSFGGLCTQSSVL